MEKQRGRRRERLWTLLLLYVIQGLPYGFQARFLPIFLRGRGLSLTDLGLLKLLLAPWLCKALWAPLVERRGGQRAWLLASVVGLAATCLATSAVDPDDLVRLSCVMFLLNLFAATQDIAVDGIAIATLSADELGDGNTAQVVGYKLGSVVGGGALAWTAATVGWRWMFVGLAGLYAAAVWLIYSCDALRTANAVPQRATRVRSPSDATDLRNASCPNEHSSCDADQSHDMGSQHQLNDIRSRQLASSEDDSVGFLRQMIRVPGTTWMLVYVLVYKLGEVGSLAMLPLFLIDQHYDPSVVSFWTAVVGPSLSIFGSLLGGWLISHKSYSALDLLRCCVRWRLLPLVVLAFVVLFWTDSPLRTVLYCVSLCAMCAALVLSGLVTTATFTLMMHCSRAAPPGMRATHYTALSTAEVLGKLSFMSLAGWLTDAVGYGPVYVGFVALALAAVPCAQRRYGIEERTRRQASNSKST